MVYVLVMRRYCIAGLIPVALVYILNFVDRYIYCMRGCTSYIGDIYAAIVSIIWPGRFLIDMSFTFPNWTFLPVFLIAVSSNILLYLGIGSLIWHLSKRSHRI